MTIIFTTIFTKKMALFLTFLQFLQFFKKNRIINNIYKRERSILHYTTIYNNKIVLQKSCKNVKMP